MSESAANAKTKKIRYSVVQIQFQLTQNSIVAKKMYWNYFPCNDEWSRNFSSMKFLTTSLEIFYDLTNSENEREYAWKKQIYTIVLASTHTLCWASNIFSELPFLPFYLIRHFCPLTVGVVVAIQKIEIVLYTEIGIHTNQTQSLKRFSLTVLRNDSTKWNCKHRPIFTDWLTKKNFRYDEQTRALAQSKMFNKKLIIVEFDEKWEKITNFADFWKKKKLNDF